MKETKVGKKLKNQKAITLIALVITIIVLLILAAVSIATLTGENGILTNATKSQKENIIGAEKEAIRVAYNGVMANNLAKGVTASELQSELHNNGYTDATVTGTTLLEVTFSSGNIYNVKNNGEINIKTASDNEIVDILSEGVAVTRDGRVILIDEKASEPAQNVWNEVEIGQEIEGINGVLKNKDNRFSHYIIDNSGNLYAWGNNDYGQLGIGSTEEYQTTPQKINGISNVEDVYTDGYSVIAKDKEGNLYAWGNNYMGRLGIGNTEKQTTPQKINGISNIEDVYTEEYSVIAKDKGGNLYAWGNNNYGQLGIGSTEEYKTAPQKINGISNIEDVYKDVTSVIAKDKEGNLYAWGSNWRGSLGIGNTDHQTVPTLITGINNIQDVYTWASGNSVIAKDKEGNLYAWGNNEYGQLGIGNTDDQSIPKLIEEISNIEDVHINWGNVIAKDKNGNLYAWGNNEYGQLGIGSTDGQTIPTSIAEISNIEDIYTDGDIVIAKESNGKLYSWGRNDYGQLGIESTLENILKPQCINTLSGQALYNKSIELFKSFKSGKSVLYYIITGDGDVYSYRFSIPSVG